MPDLVALVPSRGRPVAARALADIFRDTCVADTQLVVVVDDNDPALSGYEELAAEGTAVCVHPSRTMVQALNLQAVDTVRDPAVFAVGFMGDDHCPRTYGWDAAYLAALREMGTGIVYGDDLLQGPNLPTQCALTADIVRTLGYLCPPPLRHLYVDNFWLQLGRGADCIRYLPDVIVEHRHPLAGKAAWDSGYMRVNDHKVYAEDRAAFTAYAKTGLSGDVDRVRALRAAHG